MLRKKGIWEKLTGKYLAEALVAEMGERFGDFAQVQRRYHDAMGELQKCHGACCKDEMEAIDRQIRSLVLFSGMLGLKANWDHFVDPIARSFLDVDADVYLREETAHMLPEYENAQLVRNEFCARLSPAEQEIYQDVLEYTCYLETVAPKLAHYYGYLLGNELLAQVIPGYHPDTAQTAQYEAMLSRYFGKGFA